jgi:hypothetical protein
MTDALIQSLHREVDDILDDNGKKTKKLSLIADAIVDRAIQGDVAAFKEICDRVEGKAVQAVEHIDADEEDLNITITLIDGANGRQIPLPGDDAKVINAEDKGPVDSDIVLVDAQDG